MANKIVIDIQQTYDIIGKLQSTISEIDENSAKAVKAAKCLKNECDSSAMMLIPSLSTCAKSYVESMNKHVNTLMLATEIYQKIDKDIANKTNDATEIDEIISNYKSIDEDLFKNISFENVLKNYKGKPQYDDKCTYISTAMMIERLEIISGKYQEVSWKTVKKALDNDWRGKKDANINGNSYDIVKKNASNILGNSPQENLKQLLEKHPEGVVIYCGYTTNKNITGSHAVLITGYEDGHFKCLDPVSTKYDKVNEINLEKSWLFSGNSTDKGKHSYKSVDDLLSHAKSIMYVDN